MSPCRRVDFAPLFFKTPRISCVEKQKLSGDFQNDLAVDQELRDDQASAAKIRERPLHGLPHRL
jgi:hypothetical protein